MATPRSHLMVVAGADVRARRNDERAPQVIVTDAVPAFPTRSEVWLRLANARQEAMASV